jgi:ABC-type dipeptide/oligopeptide/nickel transport system permease component
MKGTPSGRAIDATPIEPVKGRVPWRLLLVAGPPLVLATAPLPGWLGAVLAIGWIFLGIPTGILLTLDWYRNPHSGSAAAAWAQHGLRVPIFVLGVVSVLIGVSVLGWVAYNVFWERQPAFRWGASLGLQFTFIAFGWYLIRLAVDRGKLKS